MKQIHRPPHGPLCDCGWALPARTIDPIEWASFERPDVLIECPECGELWLYEPVSESLQ